MKSKILCIKTNGFIVKDTFYWCETGIFQDNSGVMSNIRVYSEEGDKTEMFHCDRKFLLEHFIIGDEIRDYQISKIL